MTHSIQTLPVIMAGGSGTRLWPLSRSQYPKQFLALAGFQETLLQQTVQRLQGMNVVPPLVVCNEEHRFLVAEQLRQIQSEASILLEPEGRNTAPTVAIAALRSLRAGQDPVLLVLPADHWIGDADAFQQSLITGVELAKEDYLVTLGVTPTSPETGFGYIEQGEALTNKNGSTIHQFVEKPDIKTAQRYLESGNYLWNSGIFIVKASKYLSELEKYSPLILDVCKKSVNEISKDLTFERVDREAFLACPSDSIDYAIMEKTQDAVVVGLTSNWSDLGSWVALWENGNINENGNVLIGDTIEIDCHNNFIQSTNRLVATVGLENHIVIETTDAVLVAHKDKAQQVKDVVKLLASNKREEEQIHPKVFRPWGSYEMVDIGSRYKVKRISVKPGESLSTQLHRHRAEHWVVVKGTARVTNGEVTYLLSENESTFIPVGQVHRLENPGDDVLELIEVQSGDYLAEDDIVRFDDRYGRK